MLHDSPTPSDLISALASLSASLGTLDKKRSSFALVAMRAFTVNSSASELSFLGAPVLLLRLVAMSQRKGKVAKGRGGVGARRKRVLRGGEIGKALVDQCTWKMLYERAPFSRLVITGRTREAQHQNRLGQRVHTKPHGYEST